MQVHSKYSNRKERITKEIVYVCLYSCRNEQNSFFHDTPFKYIIWMKIQLVFPVCK